MPRIVANKYMYGAKHVYLNVSFYEDINDPIILKTTHFIDYNLLLFFQLLVMMPFKFLRQKLGFC